MNKRFRLIAMILSLTVAFGTPAYGWDNLGHMAVAAVAYQQLKPAVKDRVDALLRLNPDRKNWLKLIPAHTSADKRRTMVFMIAATWPDRIKSMSNYTDAASLPGSGGNRPDPNDPRSSQNIGYADLLRHKYWHFVDEPFTQEPGTHLEPVPSPNALTQITTFRQVLASNRPDALKSYDLSWLLHIVGDVHQPLHSAARFGAIHPHGDAGGNLVTVCDPGCVKLHAFWDDLLGTSDKPADALTVALSLAAAPAALANVADASKWVDESFQAAQQSVYVTPVGLGQGKFTLTQPYENNARALARERVALAGARLANILNNELK
jgi:hypothetical protein